MSDEPSDLARTIATAVHTTLAALDAQPLRREPRTWFNSKQAADFLSLGGNRLVQLRAKRIGPKFSGAGKNIRYQRKDLEAWLIGGCSND